MNLDIVSYLMGKVGGGGSGGDKNLLNSDWLRNYETNVSVVDNNIEWLSGGTSHDAVIAPPASVDGQNKFRHGHSFAIAFEVKEIKARINFYIASNGSSSEAPTVHSATGLLTVMSNGNVYVTQTGKDVLTFDGPHEGSSSSGLTITAVGSGGSSSSTATGLVEVTGLSYDGQLIFGSVTPPNA